MIGGESSLTRIAETAASKDITTNRSQIWSVTLEIIKNNPIFGAGLGAFGIAYTPHDPLNGLERVEQAHNDYLQVLADGGITGVIFVGMLIKLGWNAAKISNPYRRGVAIGAFSGCFAILIHSLFDFVLHTTAVSIMFLTLISLLAVSGKGKAEEAYPEKKRKRKANVTPIEEGRKKSDRIDLT
jgi:O-antigen ligase